MSLTPAAKNCSASLSVDTVIPFAPAFSWRCATGKDFAVFTWGLKRTPSRSICACMRAMFASMRARSTTAAGVDTSARGLRGIGAIMMVLQDEGKR